MPEQVDLNPEMQRHFAARCNDAAWNLIEKSDFGPDEIAQLVIFAATARYHWHEIGKPPQIAHADLLFGWAMARAGSPEIAVLEAGKALSCLEENGAMWERAFAHAAMAAACEASRNNEGFRLHFSKAKILGAKLAGPDADYFHAAFATISKPD